MDTRMLTREGVVRAAKRIGCDEAAMHAVVMVETNGRGFLPDGRPKVLFERHKFHQFTKGQYDLSHPGISCVAPGGYGPPAKEWLRLYEALQLDPDAAIASASWGIGQVMGFNWAKTGEKSPYGFLLANHHNEDAQLMLMAEFICSSAACRAALIEHRWADFAAIYNGPAYERNKYDERLARAHATTRKVVAT